MFYPNPWNTNGRVCDNAQAYLWRLEDIKLCEKNLVQMQNAAQDLLKQLTELENAVRECVEHSGRSFPGMPIGFVAIRTDDFIRLRGMLPPNDQGKGPAL